MTSAALCLTQLVFVSILRPATAIVVVVVIVFVVVIIVLAVP